MAQEEDHFREFVTGFADPLSRLAFLLTAGSQLDATELTNHALAQVRREWREAETTGTPEAQAVEELVIALPRRGKEQHEHGDDANVAVPDDARVLETREARPVVPTAAPRSPYEPPRSPYEAPRSPYAPPRSPYAPPVEPEADAPADADGRDVDATDAELLRDAVWTAWTTLPPRLRVPLVFADASVASRRLAGLDVPESFGSSHRQEVVAADALRLLRARVLSDLPQVGAESLAGGRLSNVLDSTLREHSGAAPAPIDPYPLVLARLRRLRLRAATVAGVVVVVLGAAVAVAVHVSTPDKATSAAAVASQSGFLPNAQFFSPAPVSAAPAPASGLPAQGPFAPVARPGIPTLVVPWVTRGTDAKDAELIANLKSYFATVHTDAVGQTQVLLATDTSAFRIAYVTANSPNGVIQSWFYGPIGSENLLEGATSYGGSLLPTSVLTDGLIDPSGHEEFIVIAPPDTTGMQIADFDFTSRHVTPGFAPLPYQNGIAVKDMTGPGSSASGYVVDVTVGTATYTLKDAPDIQLIPRFSGSITSNGPPSSSPLPTPNVERGKPDPTLVTEALQVAATWEKASPSVAAHPVVLWGGTDAAGTRLVVLRVDTQVVDLIVLEWSGDAPGLHGELLIHSAAPEVPVAFSYRALDGVRIGVIGSYGAQRAVLQFDGKASAPVALEDGFASFAVTNPSPPPSNDATSDLDVVASVQLFDASDHLIATVPEPPSV